MVGRGSLEKVGEGWNLWRGSGGCGDELYKEWKWESGLGQFFQHDDIFKGNTNSYFGIF